VLIVTVVVTVGVWLTAVASTVSTVVLVTTGVSTVLVTTLVVNVTVVAAKAGNASASKITETSVRSVFFIGFRLNRTSLFTLT
jgi:hypothetical protein